MQNPTVVEFRQDEEGHWIVALSCGHTQHLRHDPPWQSRAWVLDPVQRRQKTGSAFNCGWCGAVRPDSDNLRPR